MRVYNPFPHGRDSPWLRLGSLLTDFERLNRRMHKKLLIADGQVAIVGGRNLAIAYFMRSQEANFLDFDLLCVGAVAPAPAGHFDTFWNSHFAVPLPDLANNGLDADQRRHSFEVLTAQAATEPLSDASPREAAAAWPAGQEALGAYPLVTADAQIFFDSPEKTAGLQRTGDLLPMAGLLAGAREKVVIVTPYFLPSAAGMDRLRAAKAKGVAVQVITNSLQDGDEPLVSVAYGQRRLALLSAGVRLFEISSARLRRTDKLGKALGASVGSLHAKLGIIDNSILLVGSMNLDPRSATTNTELALAIHSPALVRQVLAEFQPTDGLATLEVRSRSDGQTLEWVERDGASNETVNPEPSLAWWRQAWLWWLYRFIPDALL